MAEPSPLSFAARVWFAFACFFRVLFDADFAARAFAVRDASATPALPSIPLRMVPPEELKATLRETPKAKSAPVHEPALVLLALLQREGRLIDFLEQSIVSYPDADVGAAARAVHEGCRKALRDHLKLTPIRAEEEGARVTLEAGFDAQEIKLTGNVKGSAPYSGVLRHPGWRATDVRLPEPLAGRDATILFEAEVEL